MNLSFGRCEVPSALRGEETRRRVLDAALRIFAEVGYEAAHTRQIAEEARVKLPTIAYYFGSKEGLFRAVIEHIASQYQKRMEPIAARVRASLLDPAVPRETLLDLLCELLETFVAVMFSPAVPKSWRQILVRTEVESVSGLDALRNCIRAETVHPCKALIARLAGEPESGETTLMRAAALLGQINIFSKPQVMQGLGWTDYTKERVEAIQSIVCGNARAIFAARSDKNEQ